MGFRVSDTPGDAGEISGARRATAAALYRSTRPFI